MNFIRIAERFETSPSGTDSFKAFYKDAFALMKEDPENAGLYFVVGIAAQSFVRMYEDQGITADFADAAKATLAGFNARLLASLSAEPLERLKQLGEVAIEYEWKVTSF